MHEQSVVVKRGPECDPVSLAAERRSDGQRHVL